MKDSLENKMTNVSSQICKTSLLVILVISSIGCEEEWQATQGPENVEESEFQKERAYLNYAMSKVKNLDFPPYGKPEKNNTLMRSLWKFHLEGEAPPLGAEIRDNQLIYLVQNIADDRRIRVFSKDGVIFRITGFTTITQITDREPEYVLEMIKEVYGEPNREIMDELTYMDSETVIIFKVGGGYLVMDIFDFDTSELPEHIYILNDTNYGKLRATKE